MHFRTWFLVSVVYLLLLKQFHLQYVLAIGFFSAGIRLVTFAPWIWFVSFICWCRLNDWCGSISTHIFLLSRGLCLPDANWKSHSGTRTPSRGQQVVGGLSCFRLKSLLCFCLVSQSMPVHFLSMAQTQRHVLGAVQPWRGHGVTITPWGNVFHSVWSTSCSFGKFWPTVW